MKIKLILFILLFIEITSLAFYGIFKFSNLVFDINFKTRKSIVELIPHPIFYQSKNEEIFDPNTVVFPLKSRFGEPYKFVKEKNKINIFMTGGSTLEGDGVEKKEDTIPFILERILNDSCRNNFKVFNYGVSGYSSKQEFLTAALKLIPYNDVDIIISLNGVNDFIGNIDFLNRNSQNVYYSTLDNKEIALYNYVNARLYNKIISFILNNTYIGNLSFDIITNYIDPLFPYKITGGNLADISNFNQESINKYIYFVNSTNELLAAKKIKFFHFIQPVIFYKKFPDKNELDTLNGVKGTYAYAHIPNYMFNKNLWDQFSIFYEEIRNLLKNKTYDFSSDLSQIFLETKGKTFVDHAHYSVLGNKIIAEEIFKKIKYKINCN